MITPREILTQNPTIRESDEFAYWGHTTPLESMLATLDGLDKYGTLLDLDKRDEAEAELAYNAAYILGQFDPEAVYRHYGDEGLVFVAANAPTSYVGEQFNNALAELAGYDKGLFEKARLWAWQKSHTAHCREILSQYAVMEKVTSEWLSRLDIADTLRRHVLPGIRVGDARLADYSLLPLRSKDSYCEPAGWDENWARDFEPEPQNGHPNAKPFKRFDVWLDAPTGYALAYKGMPQAMVAVSCLNQQELIINQLQGVRAKLIDPKSRYGKGAVIGSVASRGLMPFDWQAVMVDVSSQLAHELGMDSLAIQGGENNVWRHKHVKGELGPHISAETAARAYDAPAERLGFVLLEDGNWHWKIKK